MAKSLALPVIWLGHMRFDIRASTSPACPCACTRMRSPDASCWASQWARRSFSNRTAAIARPGFAQACDRPGRRLLERMLDKVDRHLRKVSGVTDLFIEEAFRRLIVA